MQWVRYGELRQLLEGYGWTLQTTWPPYHVWTKPGNLPILVEIHDHKVRANDVKRIRKAIEREQRKEPGEGA